MTQENAQLMTRRGAEVLLEWPGLVVLAYDRPYGIESGQFASTGMVTRAEVEARARQALVRA